MSFKHNTSEQCKQILCEPAGGRAGRGAGGPDAAGLATWTMYAFYIQQLACIQYINISLGPG